MSRQRTLGHIGNSRYALSYDQSRSIALKRGSLQGEVLAGFTNASTIDEILAVFEPLAR